MRQSGCELLYALLNQRENCTKRQTKNTQNKENSDCYHDDTPKIFVMAVLYKGQSPIKRTENSLSGAGRKGCFGIIC